MNTKKFTQLFLGLGLLFFFSCQKEETGTETSTQATEDLFAKNWQEADLSTFFTAKEINYAITTAQLQNVVANKEVTQVRFVPGILANEVAVKILGVMPMER